MLLEFVKFFQSVIGGAYLPFPYQLLRKVLHKFIIQYGAGWRVYLNLIGKGLDKGLIGEHFRPSG